MARYSFLEKLKVFRGGRGVQRIDGNYLYQVGSQIHPLKECGQHAKLDGKTATYGEIQLTLLFAESMLEPLLTRSVFRLRTSVQTGFALLNSIRALKFEIERMNEEQLARPLDVVHSYSITSSLTAFENVLGAELALSPTYVVTPKAGFDTAILIESGEACFPGDIFSKVPEAIPDLKQGTKCIAFELPTAAGFHLHRANESVLRKYWEAVANGAPAPTTRNMGDFLAGMDRLNVGTVTVKAALRDLKNFHRNPLVHPEHSIDTIDDAIALMNSIHNVMVQMLREIPLGGFVTAPQAGSLEAIGGPSGPTGAGPAA